MAGSDKTNNDRMMQKTGLLIVYAWVALAVGFFILTAWDPTYLASAENYVSILAIIGGPALLVVTKIIETWNQEKQVELQDYEFQANHERSMNEILVKHQADMERNPRDDSQAQAATDGVQDLRLKNIENDIANAISEIVLVRDELDSNGKGK